MVAMAEAERAKKKAEDALEQLRSAREQTETAKEADRLSKEAAAFSEQGKIQDAIATYDKALSLYRQSGNTAGEAATLNNIGQAYEETTRYAEALEYYERALSLYQRLDHQQAIAEVLNEIGTLKYTLALLSEALKYYEKALETTRRIGDKQIEVRTINNIGYVYSDIGEKEKALAYFEKATKLARELGDKQSEGLALNSIGSTYYRSGDVQQSLNYLQRALPALREAKDGRGEASTLANIGMVYSVSGDKQKALGFFEQALVNYRALKNGYGETFVLQNLGSVYSDLGEPVKALDYYNMALSVAREIGDRRREATLLVNIGLANDLSGKKQAAFDFYMRALHIFKEIADRSGEAGTLNNIGKAYLDLGDRKRALPYFEQALLLRKELGDRSGEAATLYNLARAERDNGNLSKAQKQVEEAIALLNSLRSNITRRDLRGSFSASLHDYYELYIDLLMQQQNPGLALQVSERARAGSLLESLEEARAEIRNGVDPGLLERERILMQSLNEKSARQIQLMGSPKTSDQLAVLKKDIDILITDYQEVEAQIRKASPRYAAMAQPQQLSLAEIQKQLDDDTLLLEYYLGEKRSYLWVVSTSSITAYPLPPRQQIETLTRRVLELFRSPSGQDVDERYKDLEKEMTSLSQVILKPAASHLLQNKRLVIVADEALRYIPFAAMPDPTVMTIGQPLVLEHEIANLPSASIIATLRQELAQHKPAPKTIAVFADPVFSVNDERVELLSNKNERKPIGPIGGLDYSFLPRLVGTRREAELILKLIPPGEGLIALGFDANRETVMSGKLSQYRIIHFATPAIFDSEHPELTSLVLSLVDSQGRPRDGLVRLYELFNLKLSAELVVLTGCDTASGKEVQGEGMIGFVRGFMYAGAPRVIGSLWKTDDQAAAEFMGRFYQYLFRGHTPVAALRAAQIEMSQYKQWRHPFYWAAFTLQGEWR